MVIVKLSGLNLLTHSDCPFFKISKERIAFSKGLCIALWDGFPVSEGHLLLVPKRHIPTWGDLTEAERAELTDAIGEAQGFLRTRYALDGFNVGFNEGAAGAKPFLIFIFT
jgi:diadenosine tetraphosphate (Ap4A) HIT family hydrolase